MRGEFAFSIRATKRYDTGMALVRILVDGYSLLHSWPELAPGKPRHSAAARDELMNILTRYHDTIGTPITIFFDGSGARASTPKREPADHVEVLFSRAGQTADEMIERSAHRFQPYGEVLAVTNDRTEREVVIGLGGHAASCLNFIRDIQNALAISADDLKHYNRTERNRFNQAQ